VFQCAIQSSLLFSMRIVTADRTQQCSSNLFFRENINGTQTKLTAADKYGTGSKRVAVGDSENENVTST
jgi:hypothetical protein